MIDKYGSQYQKFIFTRTYSRWNSALGRRETWRETVDRYHHFMRSRVPQDYREDFANAVRMIHNLDVMPSMRALWTAGLALERENVCGYNCAALNLDHPKSFAELLYILLCGTGVGYSVERQVINKLRVVPATFKEHKEAIVVADSKLGWAEAFYFHLQHLWNGQIFKCDLSRVRPAGSPLKTFGGRASGPAPLKALFDFTTQLFMKRRGQKLTSVDCADLANKAASAVVVGGVRRSACICLTNLSDDRMAKYKTGSFQLVHPWRQMANISVAYTDRPSSRKLLSEWIKLIESNSGERGIFNRAAINSQIPARRQPREDWLVNPCLSGSTQLLTSHGFVPLEQLAGKSVSVVTPDGALSQGTVWATGVKPVVKIKFSSPVQPPITCTADHVFRLADGSSCNASELPGKRLMQAPYVRMPGQNRAFVAGFIMGDGLLTRLKSPIHKGLEVCLGEKDQDILNFIKPIVPDLRNNPTSTKPFAYYSQEARKIALEFNLPSKILPERYLHDPTTFSADFIAGLFSANGSVIEGHRIALKTTCKKLAEQLKEALAKYQINAYITTNKPHRVKFSNGTYLCKQSYDLNINAFKDVFTFAQQIGFVHTNKREKLKRLLSKGVYVKQVAPAGEEMVYDFNVPDGHWGVIQGGIVTHNCGEIILRPNQFCNLSEVVVRPADNIETLSKKVEAATILGMVQSTLTDFKFLRKTWKTNCEEERLLGVSLTGLADHPNLSRVVLGTQKTLLQLRDVARQTAATWAKILGVNMPAAITCVKPSGTVSQLVNCASGLHSRYAPYYIRRVRVATVDPICQYLIDKGVPNHPEVGQAEETCNTRVFEFPERSPKSSRLNQDMSSVDQLGYWLLLKDAWCEHNPSCTIFVKEYEWIRTLAWVERYWDLIGGLSFLPADSGGYLLAPLEEIDVETYHKRVVDMPELDFSDLVKYERIDQGTGSTELACSAGSCAF